MKKRIFKYFLVLVCITVLFGCNMSDDSFDSDFNKKAVDKQLHYSNKESVDYGDILTTFDGQDDDTNRIGFLEKETVALFAKKINDGYDFENLIEASYNYRTKVQGKESIGVYQIGEFYKGSNKLLTSDTYVCVGFRYTGYNLDIDFDVEEYDKNLHYASDDSTELWAIVKKEPDRATLERHGRDYVAIYARKTDHGLLYKDFYDDRALGKSLGDVYRPEDDWDHEYWCEPDKYGKEYGYRDDLKYLCEEGIELVCVGYRILPIEYSKYSKYHDEYVKWVSYSKEDYDRGYWYYTVSELEHAEQQSLIKNGIVKLVDRKV